MVYYKLSTYYKPTLFRADVREIAHGLITRTIWYTCVSNAATYLVCASDNSMQLDDVGMDKLAHDGCLLKELHFSLTIPECLHSDLPLLTFHPPNSFAHTAKVATTKVGSDPIGNVNR